MAVTDYKFPGTATNLSTPFNNPWSNVNYVKTDDSNESTASNSLIETDRLSLTNFGFDTDDIPDGSSVIGVEVVIECQGTDDMTQPEAEVKLFFDIIDRYDYSDGGGLWSITGLDTTTYGSSTDTWSSGIDEDDVRSTAFGVQIIGKTQNNEYDTGGSWSINYVKIRVHYIETPSVTDYKFAGTTTNADRDSKVSWINTDYAKADDTSYASCDVAKNTYGDWLRLTNFGFDTDDIPTGSTISGIEFVVSRKGESLNQLSDSAIYMRDSTGQVGDNQASATLWPTIIGEATYGGVADMFGTTLDEDDILASTFGIDISSSNLSTFNAYNAYIDYIKIRIHYTTPAGGTDSLKTVFGIPIANIKTIMGVPIANIKSFLGIEK